MEQCFSELPHCISLIAAFFSNSSSNSNKLSALNLLILVGDNLRPLFDSSSAWSQFSLLTPLIGLGIADREHSVTSEIRGGLILAVQHISTVMLEAAVAVIEWRSSTFTSLAYDSVSSSSVSNGRSFSSSAGEKGSTLPDDADEFDGEFQTAPSSSRTVGPSGRQDGSLLAAAPILDEYDSDISVALIACGDSLKWLSKFGAAPSALDLLPIKSALIRAFHSFSRFRGVPSLLDDLNSLIGPLQVEIDSLLSSSSSMKRPRSPSLSGHGQQATRSVSAGSYRSVFLASSSNSDRSFLNSLTVGLAWLAQSDAFFILTHSVALCDAVNSQNQDDAAMSSSSTSFLLSMLIRLSSFLEHKLSQCDHLMQRRAVSWLLNLCSSTDYNLLALGPAGSNFGNIIKKIATFLRTKISLLSRSTILLLTRLVTLADARSAWDGKALFVELFTDPDYAVRLYASSELGRFMEQKLSHVAVTASDWVGKIFSTFSELSKSVFNKSESASHVATVSRLSSEHGKHATTLAYIGTIALSGGPAIQLQTLKLLCFFFRSCSPSVKIWLERCYWVISACLKYKDGSCILFDATNLSNRRVACSYGVFSSGSIAASVPVDTSPGSADVHAFPFRPRGFGRYDSCDNDFSGGFKSSVDWRLFLNSSKRSESFLGDHLYSILLVWLGGQNGPSGRDQGPWSLESFPWWLLPSISSAVCEAHGSLPRVKSFAEFICSYQGYILPTLFTALACERLEDLKTNRSQPGSALRMFEVIGRMLSDIPNSATSPAPAKEIAKEMATRFFAPVLSRIYVFWSGAQLYHDRGTLLVNYLQFLLPQFKTLFSNSLEDIYISLLDLIETASGQEYESITVIPIPESCDVPPPLLPGNSFWPHFLLPVFQSIEQHKKKAVGVKQTALSEESGCSYSLGFTSCDRFMRILLNIRARLERSLKFPHRHLLYFKSFLELCAVKVLPCHLLATPPVFGCVVQILLWQLPFFDTLHPSHAGLCATSLIDICKRAFQAIRTQYVQAGADSTSVAASSVSNPELGLRQTRSNSQISKLLDTSDVGSAVTSHVVEIIERLVDYSLNLIECSKTSRSWLQHQASCQRSFRWVNYASFPNESLSNADNVASQQERLGKSTINLLFNTLREYFTREAIPQFESVIKCLPDLPTSPDFAPLKQWVSDLSDGPLQTSKTDQLTELEIELNHFLNISRRTNSLLLQPCRPSLRSLNRLKTALITKRASVEQLVSFLSFSSLSNSDFPSATLTKSQLLFEVVSQLLACAAPTVESSTILSAQSVASISQCRQLAIDCIGRIGLTDYTLFRENRLLSYSAHHLSIPLSSLIPGSLESLSALGIRRSPEQLLSSDFCCFSLGQSTSVTALQIGVTLELLQCVYSPRNDIHLIQVAADSLRDLFSTAGASWIRELSIRVKQSYPGAAALLAPFFSSNQPEQAAPQLPWISFMSTISEQLAQLDEAWSVLDGRRGKTYNTWICKLCSTLIRICGLLRRDGGSNVVDSVHGVIVSPPILVCDVICELNASLASRLLPFIMFDMLMQDCRMRTASSNPQKLVGPFLAKRLNQVLLQLMNESQPPLRDFTPVEFEIGFQQRVFDCIFAVIKAIHMQQIILLDPKTVVPNARVVYKHIFENF